MDITSGSSGSHVEVRSLSVPALGISSVRLGGANEAEGRREVDRGVLVRRPPRDLHVPHQPPTRLQLTGTRVGAEENNTRSHFWQPESLGYVIFEERKRVCTCVCAIDIFDSHGGNPLPHIY